MIKEFITNKTISSTFLLKAKFEDKKQQYFFDDSNKQTSIIFLGKKEKFDLNKLKSVFNFIISNKNRSYQIDASTFKTNKINETEILKTFIYTWYEINGKKFNLKSNIEKPKKTYILISNKNYNIDEDILIASQLCEIKFLQDMAPNILTISKFVSYAKKLATNNKNVDLKILDIPDLKKLNMNLILAVNNGSKEKAKVIILNYKGNKSSKNTDICFVGKGITFDSGGYNLKRPGKFMIDMKYDMSGAAISMLLVDTISKMKINKNISCVVPITDNMVDSLAQLPESIFTSMSGKTIEVANTDAEGRLILADAITYAAKVLDSTLIIDLSTLTGTVIYALGKYTGVWSTNDKYWQLLNDCAKETSELIWRMPLDDIYLESLSKNTFADYLSCSLTDKPDSNIAAAWLNKFALNKDYIHLDIAGSAEHNSEGKAPMFKSLILFSKKFKKITRN